MKIREMVGGGHAFWCPGCVDVHVLNTDTSPPNWLRLRYNDDPERPTFHPNIVVEYRSAPYEDAPIVNRCHAAIENGVIRYFADCTHKLANQTLLLPDWPFPPGTYPGELPCR